jgi:hypothetical protein
MLLCQLMHCPDTRCYYCYGSEEMKVMLSGSPSVPPLQAQIQHETLVICLLLLLLDLSSACY